MPVRTALPIVLALLLSVCGDALAAAFSAPPVDNPRAIAAKSGPRLLLGASVAPAVRIALPAPTAAESSALRGKSAAAKPGAGKRQKPEPPVIGFGRDLPAQSRRIELDSLEWRRAPDGTRAAQIELISPGAAGVRIALSIGETAPDMWLRFSGSGTQAQVFGPVAANAVAEATRRRGLYWTPVLAGERAVIEIDVPADAQLAGVVLTIERISHLALAGEALLKAGAADIGASGSCEVDLACVMPSQALIDTANAVGRMVITQQGGRSITCTGTLLADTTATRTPYFFSAAHCIDSAAAAESINVYWFFRAASCGSTATPPYVLQGGGSALLARSDDWDWALVRMTEAAPPGTRFSAWRAEALVAGDGASTVHHPQGDLAKYSVGSVQGYTPYEDGSSFVDMRWTQGTTEPGSSGAGLFTFQPSGGYYELRGGLWAGDASCANRAGIDEFSRLDNMLPVTRQYLTPDKPDAQGRVVVVEFFNPTLGHYFMSTNPDEIDKLDTGFFKGWERTGARFLAWPSAAPGTNPVCRFYLRPQVGDSHFYSADPTECAQTLQRFGASWIYEAPDVFYIALPDRASGACPAGTRPVWRFLNNTTPNHRYTVEVTLRDELRADPAWTPEGYGADAVAMCSPS